MHRAQASVTAIEAGIGGLLLMSLVFVFVLGGPGAGNPQAQTQLDLYADDAATLLSNEQPRHADQTRIAEVTRSQAACEREADALERRVERILPPNVLFQVETAYGTVGYPLPVDVRTGTTTVPTTNGKVTFTVWYA
jgi:hypothetical protein